jgi:hypothetical protein
MLKYDFTAHLTRFSRVCRDHGMLVGPQEIADAVRAIEAIDMMDYGRVYWTLRSVFLSRHDEITVFDSLFQKFWNFEPMPERGEGGDLTDKFGLTREFGRRPSALQIPEHDETSKDTLVQILRTGASRQRVLSRPDLTVLRSDEMSEMSRIAARMVRAMSTRPGRRRKRHPRKGSLDLRGALRLSLTTGGDPLRVPRRRRVPRVPRLLVILDVSGSMDRYAQLLLQLVFAVYQHTHRVETFVFSTGVTRVTSQLKSSSFGEALASISRSVNHWSGGTQIGASLDQINTRYEDLLDRYTTVFLLSDGWETGDPENLARQLGRMQRKVRKIVWLNPLIGTEDYEMATRGLKAAMPYVDYFASARDIGQLKKLPQLLRR